MSGSVHWIDEARREYEHRPWVSWALHLHVPIDADVSTLPRAVAAVVSQSKLKPADIEERLVGIAASSETGAHFSKLVRAALAANVSRW